jgi:hypothetical protein
MQSQQTFMMQPDKDANSTMQPESNSNFQQSQQFQNPQRPFISPDLLNQRSDTIFELPPLRE